LEEAFTSDELESIARRTGFCKRKSKVDPSVFFDLMMYDISSGKSKSLNQLSIEAQSVHDLDVTKQGIDKKFNDHTLAFIKNLIEKQLSVELNQRIEDGWLGSFNRVTIKDGTRFNLPEDFKDHYPGSGGSGSNAGACLQYEFDLKSGQVTDLSLSASNRPDVCDALEVLNNIAKGDLVIRDLGYYAFESFLNIVNKGAFFLSRLRPKISVFEMKSGKLQMIDFKLLYHSMKRHHQSCIYKDVFIGTATKLPVRLVIELMPDEIYQERLRKIHKSNKKKGRQSSEKHKILSRFNLFITNVPKAVLPDRVISCLYRIRWQIELIFKIWKSVIGINHTRKMKLKRWLCLLYFKLLIMIVNWNISMARRNILYKWKGKLLSLNKCFKTLFDNCHRLREALRHGIKGITKFISWTDKILIKNHWLERKNKCMGLEEMFYNILLIK
jgi:hypothetical protein